MRKIKISRKGISPLIATILLIGFVIAIILLVMLWGKNYIEELAQKRGLLAEKQQECTKMQLEVVKACWRGTEAEVVLRNQADLQIHKFIFQPVGKAGEPVEMYGKMCGKDRNEECKLGSLETKAYNFEFSTDVGKVDNINIIPHLRVALGNYVPCSKQEITARLTDNC